MSKWQPRAEVLKENIYSLRSHFRNDFIRKGLAQKTRRVKAALEPVVFHPQIMKD